MAPERSIYTFDNDPFCGWAEWRYFVDFVDRLNSRPLPHLFQPELCPTRRQGDREITDSTVVWKRPHYGDTTGLCINGPHAGFVCYLGRNEVVAVRPLAADGAWHFETPSATAYIQQSRIAPDVASLLINQLQWRPLSYPHVMATLLEALDYPVWQVEFLTNIRRENLTKITARKSSEPS